MKKLNKKVKIILCTFLIVILLFNVSMCVFQANYYKKYDFDVTVPANNGILNKSPRPNPDNGTYSMLASAEFVYNKNIYWCQLYGLVINISLFNIGTTLDYPKSYKTAHPVNSNNLTLKTIGWVPTSKAVAVYPQGAIATRLCSDIIKYNHKNYYLFLKGIPDGKVKFSNITQENITKKIGSYNGTDIFSVDGYSSKDIIAYNQVYDQFTQYTLAMAADSKYMHN